MQQLLQQAMHYQKQGDLQQAALLYQTVLQHDSGHADALHGLGVLTCQAGDHAAAATLIQRAIARQRNVPRYHYNLGNVFMRQGDQTRAAAAFEATLRLDPHFAEAYHNLGVVYQSQGQLDEATAAYQSVLRLRPEDVAACNNLGTILRIRGELDAAAALYATALRLRPDFAEAHNNLGLVRQEQHDLDAARAAYETALRLKPHYADAHHNLGAVFQELGDLDAAAAAYDTTLRLEPHFIKAHWNRALVWLARGDLAQGWPAYEWRLQTVRQPEGFPQPRWDGSPLHGRTILVWAEQGVGDELLFASCLPELLSQADHVVLACEPRLQGLFSRTFPTATVWGTARDDLSWLARAPASEVYVPLGSLPLYLRPTLASFPSRQGYLVPDAARQRQYQQRLAALGPGLNVGIAWRSLRARPDPAHYTALEQWQALLQTPGVHWVNLQYDDPAEELAAVQSRFGIPIHSWDDPDLWHDLDGVAALIAALDLVIAPDTVVAQLAGSVGQAVWRLTAAAGSWTSLGTPDCPWFPSLRVLCQHQHGCWDETLAQLAHDIGCLASRG